MSIAGLVTVFYDVAMFGIGDFWFTPHVDTSRISGVAEPS